MKRLLSLLLLFPALAHAVAPTVNSSSNGEVTGNLTTHQLTRPATISDGDVSVCVIAVDGLTDVTWPSPWIEVFEEQSNGTMSLAWESNDGTEDGTTFDITTDVGENSAWRCYAVSGAEDQAPDVSARTTGWAPEPPGTAIDPPSLTPAGGSDDYLYIAFGQATNASTVTFTGFPGSYTGTGSQEPSVSGAEALAWGQRALTSSTSEDPSNFTFTTGNSGEAYIAVTIALQQVSAGASYNYCAAGSGISLPDGSTADTRQFAPCTKNEFPNLADTVDQAMQQRNLDYYIAGCGSGASNPVWSGTLPPGISIDTSGIMSGTPTVAVPTFAATVTCTNDDGTESHDFTWQIGGGGTDLTGSVIIADSTASAGGDGLTVGTAYDELSDLAGIATEDETICLMDGSDFVDETFELDVNGWTFQTCYESGGGLYAWDDGPNASSTDLAAITSTGVDCQDWKGILAVTNGADDVTINAIEVSGANHSCTLATDSASMISWDVNGSDRFTLTNSVIRPWPSEALARAAYKRHIIRAVVLARGDNYTITNNTIEYAYNGININYAQYGYIANNTLNGIVHTGISFGGNNGARHDHYTVVENNTISDMYDEDGIQFDSSHAIGTGLAENQGWVVLYGNEIYGDTGEDGIDLKGAADILIEATIVSGTPGDNDGECDGSAQLQSAACDTIGTTENDRYSKGAIMHGGGGNEVVSGNILITRSILYDNYAGVKHICNGFRASRITSVGNNKDYTGSDSSHTDTGRPQFYGAGNFVCASSEGALINSILGHSNTENIGFEDGNTLAIDGLVFMTDDSADTDYAYGGEPYTSTSTLATWVSHIQSESTFTDTNGVSGDACDTCKEATVNFISDSTDPSGVYSTQAYDFEPQAEAIDYGVPDTYATATASATTTVSVRDACMFFPRMTYGTGTWNRTRAGHYVLIGSEAVVEVTGRDCDAGTLTIAAARDVTSGDVVWLSDAAGVRYDDAGAIETDAATNPFD